MTTDSNIIPNADYWNGKPAEPARDYGFDVTPDTADTLGRLSREDRHQFLRELDAKADVAAKARQKMIKDIEIMEQIVASNERIDRTYQKPGVYRMVVGGADGNKTTVERLNAPLAGRNHVLGGITQVDPTTLDVNIGGMTLTPQQAADFLDDGSISFAQYKEAVEASARRIQPDFKLRRNIKQPNHPVNRFFK